MNSAVVAEEPILATPAALQNYLDLDLSPEGLTAKGLFSSVNSDASLEDIVLTDIIGSRPANLTPQMSDWYQLSVAPLRNEALKSLSQLFSQGQTEEGIQGFLLHSRIAWFDEELLRGKRNCYSAIAERFHAESDEINTLSEEIRADRGAFNSLKAELGREPQTLNRFAYFAGLIFILVAESFLNFASFSSLSWATPLFATGSTLL